MKNHYLCAYSVKCVMVLVNTFIQKMILISRYG